jgi:hypothetical protein
LVSTQISRFNVPGSVPFLAKRFIFRTWNISKKDLINEGIGTKGGERSQTMLLEGGRHEVAEGPIHI